jgi:hypothetical protein
MDSEDEKKLLKDFDENPSKLQQEFNEKWELAKKKEAELKKKKENEPKFNKIIKSIFWPYKKLSSNIFYSLWIVFPIGAIIGKSIDDIGTELILSIVVVFLIFRFFAWSFDNEKT